MVTWFQAKHDVQHPYNKLYWHGVDFLYQQGSQGDIRTPIYEWIRNRSNSDSFFLAPTHREIKSMLSGFKGVVVSVHAHTAVKTDAPLVVVQGDMYGGKDYAIPTADCIVVPTKVSADELVSFGIDPAKIEIVGFISDERLKNPEIRNHRLEQLQMRHGEKLHVGIYLTGARPWPHVKFIQEELFPKLFPLMRQKRIRVTLYTVTDGKLAYRFLRQGLMHGLKTIRYGDDVLDGNWDLQVVYGETTNEANERALSVLGDEANPVSILVTMPGERYCWAADVAMAPLSPINKTNAGNNTKTGIINNFFEPPQATQYLPERLESRSTVIYQDNMQRANANINRDGAENIARKVKKLILA